jgi:hypothetical protein
MVQSVCARNNGKLFAPFMLIVLLSASGVLEAQHVPSKERGDPTKRRKTNIDGNLVRTTIFNFGLTGRTGVVPDEIPYEWPKNTRQMYIALTGLFVGAEVKDEAGRTIHIVDVPSYRQSPAGKTWNLEPVPGYFREYEDPRQDKIAKSDEPGSWPAFWPDKLSDQKDPGWKGAWNGFFGKDQFNADQEMFFRASDDLYDRYNYIPDTTDRTRRGLGLLIDVRVLAWSQVLVNDVIFILHFIKNDGTKDLDKAAFTLWLADLVGGDGDSADDISFFDLLSNVAWMTDRDGRGNKDFGTTPVGVAAIAYLETPGNAVDRIDNDGDGEPLGPKVTEAMLVGEDPTNGIDDNGNGLIDENMRHVPFGAQRGTTFADGIDNNDNGELQSPVVTQQMINEASTDRWGRWPPNPEQDPDERFRGIIHLIQVGPEDLGKRFKDNIDNNGNAQTEGPRVTQAMIDEAARDRFRRYRVPGTNIVLYHVGQEDLGKRYKHANWVFDAGIDENIDEMIDESRQDGIDNDGDWNALFDDVGLDGKPGTNDYGEGDGKPTSGYQPWGPNGELVDTGLPGEPNIDKTDIGESDQIGLTNAQYFPAGSINFSTALDISFWNDWMIPGKFFDPARITAGDYDLTVSSGIFPIKSGATERISMAVMLGVDQADALRNRQVAQQAYETDYRFATAPLTPTVTAVPGNKRVTLYWDDAAEKSFDTFLARLGEDGFDFEGYKIYRATDAAFLDAPPITDADGNPVYYKPIAQFDLVNGIKGLHPIDLNGAHFNLGNDTGLRHSYVDTTVQNGQTYFYAVVAYDRGYTPGRIGPSESPVAITVDPSGKVIMGKNVVKITPNPPAAGYEPPNLGDVRLVQGSTTGRIGYTIIDPRLIRDNNSYRITFEDTLIVGGTAGSDTLKTKSFTLTNVTNTAAPETLITRSRKLAAGDEQPMTQGFQLILFNEHVVAIDQERSKWNRSGVQRFLFQQFRAGLVTGQQRPADYEITFGDVGIDTSTQFRVSPRLILPAKPVNFTIRNLSEKRKIKFGFFELDGSDGRLTSGRDNSDIIIFLEPDARDSLVATWDFRLVYDAALALPQSGDRATIILRKPFLRADVFEFTTKAARINQDLAREHLSKIKVVPNPYVAAATWEPRNPFASGRGPRAIHFNHLPQQCTIRIYTVSGELVATIEHNSTIDNGTAQWNLLSKDNLAVSYGVYIYHVDAPGIGEHTGKFAIIK